MKREESNRNVRRDVTAWIGWQRSHYTVVFTRVGHLKVPELVFSLLITINVLGYIERGHINDNILTNKEEMTGCTQKYC